MGWLVRENVIKMLERCVMPHGDGCTQECEYHGRIECCRQVMRNALALLKAQEPRVMTLEEIVGWEGAFWLEFLEEEKESYTRYGYAFFAGSTPDVIEVIARDSFRPLYAFIRSEYRIRWRCWTSRPTDEMRRATPWMKS